MVFLLFFFSEATTKDENNSVKCYSALFAVKDRNIFFERFSVCGDDNEAANTNNRG